MCEQKTHQRPADFVELGKYVPTLPIDLRYATAFNFIGRKVTAYQQSRCWLTRPTAQAIKGVQEYLVPRGYSLLIFDGYRPQRAVNEFIQWACQSQDQKMKQHFYPHVDKPDLIERGFIARRSTHSRGSTVDLTIADAEILHAIAADRASLEQRYGLDMGTHFDLFDERSFTQCARISSCQQENRTLLIEVMRQFGFENFPMEWWHFTLRDEPYKETYFDFPL